MRNFCMIFLQSIEFSGLPYAGNYAIIFFSVCSHYDCTKGGAACGSFRPHNSSNRYADSVCVPAATSLPTSYPRSKLPACRKAKAPLPEMCSISY